MLCTVHILRGTGMYTTTACMPMYSLLIAIRCGGTGAGTGVLPVRAGDSVTDGALRGTITAGILLIGTEDIMAVTGVATGEATGVPDGITTTIIPIGEETGDVRRIPITVRRAIPDILLPDEAVSVWEVPAAMAVLHEEAVLLRDV